MTTTGPKYTYKEFASGKMRWTRGRFSGWKRGGPLNVKYAMFQTRRSTLFIPEYCLTREALNAIRSLP
jgi:hypothetical protein